MSSPRGERRREALLAAVVKDTAEHGLVGFSLRRAAKAAGTTHKVLLYHFTSAEELLADVLHTLRDARLARTQEHAWATDRTTLGERVDASLDVLLDESAGPRVLDQATGLALYDPDRYTRLGSDATEQYLPSIRALVPDDVPLNERDALATVILAVLRGLLADRLTSGDEARLRAARVTLARMLDTEERYWQDGTASDSMPRVDGCGSPHLA